MRVAIIIALLLAVSARGANSPAFGPPGDWVLREAVEPSAPPEVPEGWRTLLGDRQLRITQRGVEDYTRRVIQITSAEGIDAVARLQLSIDPTWEKLTIHSVTASRDGAVAWRATREDLEVLRREPGLEGDVLDGDETHVVLARDLRVGDIVEHEFTVSGQNPIHEGRYVGYSSLWASPPAVKVRFRLLAPASRPIVVTPLGTDAQPATRMLGDMLERTWELSDVRTPRPDGDEPAWHVTWPWLQISEYGSWSEVASWGSRLIAVPESPSEPIRELAGRFTRENENDAERILAALRFVQGDIRYLSMAIGESSHRAAAPEVTLAQRRGDCKDKAVLLCSVLRVMGHDAHPALVSTWLRGHVDERPVSPDSFDHAIVRARFGTRTLWLDPTRQYQRGSLDVLSVPLFGKALVLGVEATALEEIPVPADESSGTLIEEAFDVPEPPGEAKLRVVSTHRGRAADSMRATLAGQPLDEIARNWTDHYSRLWTGTRSAAAPEVTDDERLNVLKVTESYVIPSFWEEADDHSGWECRVEDADTMPYLSPPSRTDRTSPLAVMHPVRLKKITRLDLGFTMTHSPEKQSISTPAVTCTREVAGAGRSSTITTEYVTRQDFVAAADAPAHVRDVQSMHDRMMYTIDHPRSALGRDAGSSAPPGKGWWSSPFTWVAIVLGVLLGTAGAWLIARWRPSAPPPADEDVDLTLDGIDGWLVLVAIGCVLRPVTLLVQVFAQIVPAATAEVLANLLSPSSPSYSPGHALLLLFEVSANLAFAVASIGVAVAFFRRRHAFPRAWLIVAWGMLVFVFLDTVIAGLVVQADEEAGAPLTLIWMGLVTSIWSAYFLRSERVRATFRR